MAYTKWTSIDFIEISLRDNPLKWGYFQAVRNLDSIYYTRDKAHRRTGEADTLRGEAVRYKQKPFFGFKDSEIDEFAVTAEKSPASLYVNFLGLWGTNSPLPLVFTEYAFNRAKHQDDSTLINFMDIFHHRMLSLFYKAWAINQQSVNADRKDDDKFSKYLSSIIGLRAFHTVKDTSPLSLYSRIYFSGHLMRCMPNISNLSAILSDYFKTKAEVKPFMVEHKNIPVEDRFYLSRKNRNGMLGKNIAIGEKFITSMMKFRVVLGPMNLINYMKMFPGKNGYLQLVNWVKYYVAGEFTFDIQLILNYSEVPAMSLGKIGTLGCACWLRSNPAVPVENKVVINVA